MTTIEKDTLALVSATRTASEQLMTPGHDELTVLCMRLPAVALGFKDSFTDNEWNLLQQGKIDICELTDTQDKCLAELKDTCSEAYNGRCADLEHELTEWQRLVKVCPEDSARLANAIQATKDAKTNPPVLVFVPPYKVAQGFAAGLTAEEMAEAAAFGVEQAIHSKLMRPAVLAARAAVAAPVLPAIVEGKYKHGWKLNQNMASRHLPS